MDLRDKKVTVVGLGKSGIESALLAKRQGAVVSVTDNSDAEDIRKNAESLKEKYIAVEIGGHTERFLSRTELLIVSPAVEKSSLPVRYAMERNIPIISEPELGYLFCRGPIVAVTGTNGKSTVVSLLGEILRQAGTRVNVCGNIGNPLSGEIKNIDEITEVILETSSFQLEWIESFRPKISVILNVTEDHLDRYRNFEDYLAAKKRIFKNQAAGDVIILNYDDENLRTAVKPKKIPSKVLYFSARKKVDGIYLDKGNINIFLENKVKTLFGLGDLRLKGGHNIENILASVLVAILKGADIISVENTVKSFKPLPHRFERVREIGGIEFIDDSKATNIDSTYQALKSLDRSVVLIAGGKDKNLSYEKILPAIKSNVKKIILIGETARKMRESFKSFVAVEEKNSLEEAVLAAYKSASPGDYVLLSPMCSSFDMFRDYKHRAEVFREAVNKLSPTGDEKQSAIPSLS
ncbi:MAG: UDP-N-acetylmuramoyl-L-alanine--D-glutamate ligase [Candidatus Omnitrophota bacterium]|nr:MAG: UDP-N-acetylmuramoyl-L-alanine--D-glutamate ligase [Candidatus Omnitrophota bacterium]